MLDLKNLAGRLFKFVFGWYLLLAVLVTGVQLGLEYSSIRTTISSDLVALGRSFAPGVADAMWTYDKPLLASLAKGIAQTAIITGVKIENNRGEIVATEGRIPLANEQASNTSLAPFQMHEVPLWSVSLAENHARRTLGRMVLYSDRSVVLDRIKYSFLVILINSLVKTTGLWLIFYWAITRRLSRPLTQLSNSISSLELKSDETDLVLLDYPHRDEIGMLVAALNDMRIRLLASHRELEQNTLFQRAILSSAAYGIISATPEGVITGFNPAAERLLGYAAEEVVGKQTPAIWHDSHEVEQYALRLSSELGEKILPGFDVFTARPKRDLPEEKEWTFIRKDGIRVPVSLSVTALRDESGRTTGFVGLIYDLTERKQAEEEIRQLNQVLEQRVVDRTAQLVAANKEQAELIAKLAQAHLQLLQAEKMASIGQLAAGVAHEINNPVAFVFSNLGTLQHYVGDLLRLQGMCELAECSLPEHMREDIGRLKNEIDLAFLREDIVTLLTESTEGLLRVKRIVQDLKDFAHVDESELQSVNLEQGLDSTINVAWSEIKNKAEVRREYAGIPEIECFPSQLNQVFLNLLLNASQAIDANGHILVRTGQDEDNVWIEIADDGIGIQPEHMGRIFEPFFTTKPIGKGIGLGLSLSYGIVQKHGGRIEVNSSPGKGASFRVILPKRLPRDEESPTNSPG
ncbi:MAG: ATP-binding protein [Formivibrio sp.]|nr:ATP-binding protein [Formivibrio sp.]